MYALDAPELEDPLQDARALFKGLTDRIIYLEKTIKEYENVVTDVEKERKKKLQKLHMLRPTGPQSLSFEEESSDSIARAIKKLEEEPVLNALQINLPKTIETLQKEMVFLQNIPPYFQHFMRDSSASKAVLFARRFPRYRGLVAPRPQL